MEKNKIVWEKILIPKFRVDEINVLYDILVVRQVEYLEPTCFVEILKASIDLAGDRVPALFALYNTGNYESTLDNLNEFVSSEQCDDTEILYLETVDEDHEEYLAYYNKYHNNEKGRLKS